MKLCVAQTKPIKGDIQANIIHHKKLLDLAISEKTDMVIFPELSITGYEPGLAKELATVIDDRRFDDFQTLSNRNNLTIGIGAPVRVDAGIRVGMIIFQPGRPRELYCKQYLHSDELPFFVNGSDQVFLEQDNNKTALAICYEIFVPEHSSHAIQRGANIYVASVAKTEEGMQQAGKTLSAMAKQHSITVLISNCVGHCDNFESGGKSSIWNNEGILVGQLNGTIEGIMVFDNRTGKVVHKSI